MKPLGCFFLLELLIGLTLEARADFPITAIEVSENGSVTDRSPASRSVLATSPWECNHNDQSITLKTFSALTIPYANGDPLFEPGAFTWILKCSIASPPGKPLSIARRWEPVNKRIAYIGVSIGGDLLLALSTEGTTESQIAMLGPKIPMNEPVYLILRYQPGEQLIAGVYPVKDPSNGVNQSRKEKTPSTLFNGPANLTIGAVESMGLKFYSFQSWNRTLADQEILEALASKKINESLP